MSVLTLYHGSQKIIEKPVFGIGNQNNDYGLGFYCAQDENLAKEWACQKNCDGFSNEYEIETEDLKILDLSQGKFNILHWLSILMQNRVFSPKSPLGRQNLDFIVQNYNLSYTDYDLIFGYRANDSYFSFASDFLENIIPIQNLASAMKLGSLGLQVVLKSEKAFSKIKFVKSEKAEKNIYFPKYKERDTNARKSYLEGLRKVKPTEAIYLIDILRNLELLNELSL